jgi:hypothetical protein
MSDESNETQENSPEDTSEETPAEDTAAPAKDSQDSGE